MIKKTLVNRQLFLILLGVIVVGTAIVVGMNAFTANSSQANRDAVIADLTSLASLAQEYYNKPASKKGVENSFIGWNVPPEIDTTGNGIYTAVVYEKSLDLIGIGMDKGNDGIFPVKVTMSVGPNGILNTKIEN